MQPPPHAVFAWDMFALWPPARIRADAEAFVMSSAELFSAMLEGRFPKNWATGRAAAFMFAHGLELFLKAAILQAGKEPTPTHDLRQLYRTYRNMFPGKKFDLAGGIAGFVEENVSIPFEDFLKYPEEIAQVGVTWNASIHIDIEEWQKRVVAFGSQIATLWSEIQLRFPDDPNRWAQTTTNR